MFRVFQSIREQALAAGRLPRYLAYASGEVLLIVIGILIALQLDNWNQDREDRRQLRGHFANIAENVRQDLAQAASLAVYRAEARATTAELLGRGLRDDQLLADFYAMMQATFVERYLNFNESGRTALEASGLMDAIAGTPEEAALYRYYEAVEQVKRHEESYNAFIENMEVALFESGVMIPVGAMVHGGLDPEGSEARDALDAVVREPAMQGALFRAAITDAVYDDLQAAGEAFIAAVAGPGETPR